MFTKRNYKFSFPSLFLSGLFLLPIPVSAVELVNVSTSGQTGQGAKQMVVGFVVEGEGRKQIMVSAAGPTTEVPGAIENPQLTVIDQTTGEEVYYCDDWENCLGSGIVEYSMDRNGLGLTEKEAAASLSLGAGYYSIEISDADGGSGFALGAAIEVSHVRSDQVSFGTWQSEDESICFNVVSSRLTSRFSKCPDEASLTINMTGKTPSGDLCQITAFAGYEIPIENGQINWAGATSGGSEIVTVSGVFFGPGLAIGSATSRFSGSPLSSACIAEWSAGQ